LIRFALVNDITKSLELSNLATLQVALLQMPILCLLTGFLSAVQIFDEKQAFTFIFPNIQVYTVAIAGLILCYVSIEGSCNYMQGASLLILYTVIMITFYIKYL
jgi:Ca2+:H+ antiporter